MCAISGIIGLEAGEEGIQRMLATMARRGPDGSGIYRGNGAVLLHTRLAVIDPAGGSQPMLFTQNGETYAIVYNGELYNTEELRQELQSLGHRFEGYSDTEVLLHSFVQWKEGCLEKLNGIYAFAVWLQGEQRLFLARDRIGVKPLFWKEHGGGLLFGSEIKTVLAYPGVRAELDEEGAAQLLLLGPGRMPGSGRRLPAPMVTKIFCTVRGPRASAVTRRLPTPSTSTGPSGGSRARSSAAACSMTPLSRSSSTLTRGTSSVTYRPRGRSSPSRAISTRVTVTPSCRAVATRTPPGRAEQAGTAYNSSAMSVKRMVFPSFSANLPPEALFGPLRTGEVWEK